MITDLSSVILDTICFYVHSRKPIRINFAREVLECADLDKKDRDEADLVSDTYADILRELVEGDVDQENSGDIQHLLLQYKKDKIAQLHPEIFDNIRNILLSEKRISSHKLKKMEDHIRNHLLWVKGNRTIRRMNGKSWKAGLSRDDTKQDMLLQEILQHARDLVYAYDTTAVGVQKDTVDFIDMGNRESIQKAIRKHHDRNNTSRIKLGLQGLNRMLQGGPTFGEFMAWGARSHQYKSGILIDMLRWICVHNKPKAPAGTIPAVVFISLENEAFENLFQWFKTAYIHIFHEEPVDLSDTEIAEFVMQTFTRNGWRPLIFRRIGEEFGMAEFHNLIEEQEKAGYCVQAVLIDYMQLMNTKAAENMRPDKAIQNMFGAMRDFANHNSIFVGTGVQLDGQAEIIARDTPNYKVKRYTASNIADCKAIKRELDCLIWQDIETNHLGTPYLTWCWDKRRYHEPPECQCPAYPFTAYGIMDDVGGEDRCVMDIYSVVENPEEKQQTAQETPSF